MKKLLLFLFFLLCCFGCGKKEFTVKNNLDKEVVTIDDTSMLLQDTTYYILIIEQTIEKQALIYDSTNTTAYWNTHVNGRFVKLYAKETAINRAIRDQILYHMAQESSFDLSAEEQSWLDSSVEAFYNSMSDYQKVETGLDKDSLLIAMTKATVADCFAKKLAQLNMCNSSDYTPDGAQYQKLLAQHDITIKEKLWEQVDFGNVSLEH